MSKKILVISSSLRANSNSDALADEFIRGAEEAGNKVEKISLVGKKIAFCKGCMACQKLKHCAIQDDANDITKKMLKADVIVFSTPVYYFSMSGQLKTLLDRSNSLYSSDYAFREVYLLATAAEDYPAAMNGTVKGIQGWIDCCDKVKLCGVVKAYGVNDAGTINNNPRAIKKAYTLGKQV